MNGKTVINGKVKRAILLGFDMLCFLVIDVAYFYAARSFNASPDYTTHHFIYNSLILLAAMFILRLGFSVYSNVWRYTNTRAYFNLVLADFIGSIVAFAASRAFFVYEGIWHFVNVASLSALAAIMSRLSYRLIYKHRNSSENSSSQVKVAIVGAGRLGALLAADLTCSSNSKYKPVFFIDKDRQKVGNRVYNLPVYFENASVLEIIKNTAIDEIFIALPGLSSDDASRLYEFYRLTGCKIKICDTPVHNSLYLEKTSGTAKCTVREFSIEDLLFREPLTVSDSEAFTYYTDKTVLVTGGGGSIGSELCRQIAECHPKRLVIFDIYENNAYDIQQELKRNYGDKLDLKVEIGSVRDRERLESIFKNYRPDIVFHAAAHKHVPLMEQSGCEAVKNNVFGTYNTADMAEKYGVKKFILVSTDKAVNPTNIMGASKRLCEMIVQCRIDSSTAFAAVRFGNVLGSNGSVIPLFKRQIAAGGPVTITDKRIIRYFMTIPEASQLVMQAGAMAKKGELFVLDMGKPVRIYDLARNMIKLSGYEPDVDIKIEEIGLRPGEKLYEELLMKTETLDKTENNMIFVERDTPLSREEVERKLSILSEAVERSKGELGSEHVKAAIKSVVPTFREPGEINKTAENSAEMNAVITK